MIKHYDGRLGIFDFDTDEFGITSIYGECLHYYGKGLSVDLPKGCISTRYMFYNCEFQDGFTLGDGFDTSEVRDMEGMFAGCKMPDGFSLGDKFNTSEVVDMEGMFCGCEFPKGFTLGNGFDTSKVRFMDDMFYKCKFPEGFTLGNKFNICSVIEMGNMFAGCEFSDGFSLGDKFDISGVANTEGMFYGCSVNGVSIPKGMNAMAIIKYLTRQSAAPDETIISDSTFEGITLACNTSQSLEDFVLSAPQLTGATVLSANADDNMGYCKMKLILQTGDHKNVCIHIHQSKSGNSESAVQMKLF
ncbi:MAG: BspA family leucine-rich repeat surface protein [Clostridium sp.]|nr:BspA family leucine-rich repeat surface protein [Clostridium sp.]MCM1208965.1 BspA family leucine-rich repeat surface protein [Ruminococcus sp.]